MTLEWIAHRLRSGTLTSLLCGMAWNMESMIVFRAVQGLWGVSMIPTVFTSVHGHVAALKKLWSLTYREAQVQSFADAFLAIAVCCAIATLAVPFLRKISSPGLG